MTGRCASCVHWEGRSEFHNLWSGQEADVQYRSCALVPLADTYEEPPDPLPLAVAKDGSDYQATLYTLPAFGCVQWEERP